MNPQDWVLEYSASKYFRELSDDLLQERYEMLTHSLWSTGQHGEVTPTRDAVNRRELLRLIMHVCCERSDRRGESTISFSEKDAREAASAGYRPAMLKTPFVGSPECFAKFGERDHIRNSFEKGLLRVAPAGCFNDPSLNEAQRDNELQHWTIMPNKQLMVKFYGLDATGDKVEIPVQKKEFFQGVEVQDFYVWCCSLGYDARLFHEFQAEAVLVIRHKEEFRRRLAKAMEQELPGSSMLDRALAYYDPYTIQRHQLFPIFTKNIKYLHQNEYRFAWEASKGAALDAIYPVLGPLTDIAEFYEIDPGL